jgi:hypothetical protein
VPGGLTAECAVSGLATVRQAAPAHLSPLLGAKDKTGRAPAGAELSGLGGPFPADHSPIAIAGSAATPVAAPAGVP